MVHHRQPGHPLPIEQPQVYDWAHMKKGFWARLVLPFFSTKYKTDMTMHCIIKAFADSLDVDDDDGPADPVLRELPNDPLWQAPAIRRAWDLYSFFSLYYVHFHRAAPLLFHHLRIRVWNLPEDHYVEQLTLPLRPVDGLGFSGSLFFFTDDRSYIVKSVGRQFEYHFLHARLINHLGIYFSQTPDTLLSKITDVLYSFTHRLGGYLGISPAHYLVMPNALEGLDKEHGCDSWDLKPPNFFEPTRDIVPDAIKTQQAKSGLADQLERSEHMCLTAEQKEDLMMLLRRDTKFLEDMETIDYSLLLGRYPISMFHETQQGARDPFWLPQTSGWVKGVRSADGKWVYRVCLLDFLWNCQELRPKIMRTAGKILPEQTVTTQPGRYRKEFLEMMDSYIDVWDGEAA